MQRKEQTMKAVVMTGANQPWEVREVLTPEAEHGRCQGRPFECGGLT